jgi:c(7)-type cytochrome triheme protein
MNTKAGKNWAKISKGILLTGTLLVFGSFFFIGPQITDEFESEKVSAAPLESGAMGSFEPPSEMAQSFANFDHKIQMHNGLPCLLCHKRDDNAAAPTRGGHLPCAGCHMEQFAAEKGQICTICHVSDTGQGMKKFPTLKSFDSKFDHSKHRMTSCATCHKPSRGGVALSVPAGLRAHTTCYQCHGPDRVVKGQNIGSCATCHEPGKPNRNSDWARAFRFNFSHAKHTASMNCATCHTVRPGSRPNQVSSPVAAMHFAPNNVRSCASCHDGRQAVGENFSDCRSCHTGPDFSFR